MPQGKLKAKVKVPNASKKKGNNTHKKTNLKRKGGRVIAPKKAKLVEKNKLKKNKHKITFFNCVTCAQPIRPSPKASTSKLKKKLCCKRGKTTLDLVLLKPKLNSQATVPKRNKSNNLGTSMMSGRKVKREGEEESSEEDEEEPMIVEDGEEINIDFEGFPLSDHDHDGIKQLLVQQFSASSEVNLSQLTDALITQNFIGSILKQSEMPSPVEESDDGSEVDDVFALVTCLSLTRPKDELCDSFRKYLTQKCKESKVSNDTKKKFKQIMDASTCDSDIKSCTNCLGFVCNERFVNVPPQASVPMFNKLMDEISEAKKHKHRSRFDFTHFLILAKTLEFSSSALNGKSSAGADLIYQNAEEEFFAEHASLTFDYKIHNQGDDVTKTRRALLLERDGFELALAKLSEHLNT